MRRYQALVGLWHHHFALLQHFTLKAHTHIGVISLLHQLMQHLFLTQWLSVELLCLLKIYLNKIGREGAYDIDPNKPPL